MVKQPYLSFLDGWFPVSEISPVSNTNQKEMVQEIEIVTCKHNLITFFFGKPKPDNFTLAIKQRNAYWS